MPGTPTTKWNLPTMAGTDLINQVDEWTVAVGAALDPLLAPSDQGLLASRPVSTPGSPGKIGRTYKATDTGQLFRDNGTGWDTYQSVVPVVSALPGSPYDGQEVYFDVDPDPTKKNHWHLRFNSAAGKWEPVGGQRPLFAGVDGTEVWNPGSTNAWVDAPTVGPSLNVPLAGDYEIEWGAYLKAATDSGGSPGEIDAALQIAGVLQAGRRISVISSLTPNSSARVQGATRQQVTGLAANALIKMMYNRVGVGALTISAGQRWIALTPVSVS